MGGRRLLLGGFAFDPISWGKIGQRNRKKPKRKHAENQFGPQNPWQRAISSFSGFHKGAKKMFDNLTYAFELQENGPHVWAAFIK